jgi:hypothetical protein
MISRRKWTVERSPTSNQPFPVEFQDGECRPEVVFLLRFSRLRRDCSTETDCSVVAEFTAKRIPVNRRLRPRRTRSVTTGNTISSCVFLKSILITSVYFISDNNQKRSMDEHLCAPVCRLQTTVMECEADHTNR